MSDIYLVCGTCQNDAYPAPEIDGVPTISVSTLSVLQSSQGTHALAMCPSCCDDLAQRMVVLSFTPGADEIPVP